MAKNENRDWNKVEFINYEDPNLTQDHIENDYFRYKNKINIGEFNMATIYLRLPCTTDVTVTATSCDFRQ